MNSGWATACQNAEGIAHFREGPKAVQVLVGGGLFFMPQTVLNGKKAFALLRQNGRRQVAYAVKAERSKDTLIKSSFIAFQP